MAKEGERKLSLGCSDGDGGEALSVLGVGVQGCAHNAAKLPPLFTGR